MWRRTARLLLVGNVGPQSDSLKSVLESNRIRVLVAESGRDALHASAPPADIALLSLDLPDMDGPELCLRLKEDHSRSQLQVMIASAKPVNPAAIIKCFDYGCDDFLVYPISDEELLTRVNARISARLRSQRWTNRLVQQQTESSLIRIARLDAALQIAQLGVWELTGQLGVWHNEPMAAAWQFDDRCLGVFSLSRGHTVGLDDFFALIHPEDQPKVRHSVAAALSMYGSGIFEAEFRVVGADGAERWVAMRGSEIRPEIQHGRFAKLVGTLMDTTERKRVQELLIRGERVAALGQMAATLAHEINNPLAAVMNTVFLAKTNSGDRDVLARYLEMADEQLSQVAHITRKALGFYRENSKPEEVSIPAVLEETVRLLKAKIKAKNVIVKVSETDDFRVLGVAGELRQVFSNLLANSIEAVGDDGAIHIRISRFGASQNGNSCVRITVADNGKGIEPSVMPHLFEPLYSTKGVGGTGLGLWVSRQIVEKHGGVIRVHSRVSGPRHGTVFAVFLPQSTQGNKPEPEIRALD